MKRLLMRGPSGPFDNPGHVECLADNLIGNNSGNLIYLHSVCRALMTEGVEIDCIKTGRRMTKEEENKYNEKYDAFIIPLANAFRTSFMKELRVITDMVKRLDMPCVVVGVGFQGNLDYKLDRDWDDDVRAFVDAVLEKSKMLGLRGEITADYLEHLGYTREKDFTVIGCPSMFLYGRDLPKPKELRLGRDTRVNINSKFNMPEKLHEFLRSVCEEMPDHWYVPQNLYELKLACAGIPARYTDSSINMPEGYPSSLNHPLYRENRVRGFVSAESWFRFLAEGDLTIGTRIHGNITSVLAGVPTFIIAGDARVLELAEYHKIPHIRMDEFEAGTDIYSLLEGVDFNTVLEGHEGRFNHYLDFLHANDLDTIFDHEYEKAPFDKRIESIDFNGPIIPFTSQTPEQQVDSLRLWEYEADRRDEKIAAANERAEKEHAAAVEAQKKLKESAWYRFKRAVPESIKGPLRARLKGGRKQPDKK